jgi:large subunit ribosomal protein L25
MEPVKLEATRREGAGKNVARRLRAQDQIPAVAYGRSLNATPIAVSPKALLKILQSDAGRNSFIELEIDGKETVKSVLADYQYHPVSRTLLHADFLQVDEGQTVDVDVPLELFGKSKGVTAGGLLAQVFRSLPLRCLPQNVPVKITHDITELDIEGTIKVKDLDLGEGVECRFAQNRTVAHIIAKKKKTAEEEEEEAEAAKKEGK